MKLLEKIATLFNAQTLFKRTRTRRETEETLQSRPTPTEDKSLSLNPADGWGMELEPTDVLINLVNDYIEQLALEAYTIGENFSFSDRELEARFLSFFDRQIKLGRLWTQDKPIRSSGRTRVGPDRWIEAQQIRIERLLDWWRQQGGPDIEPKVL